MQQFLSWMLVAVLLAVVAAGGWGLWQLQRGHDPLAVLPGTAPAPPPRVTPNPPPPPVPVERYPVAALLPASPPTPEVPAGEAEPAPKTAPPALPPLDDSDASFAGALQALLGETPVARLLQGPNLLRRLVASIDNLDSDRLVARIRVLRPLGGPFLVDGSEADDSLVISPRNHARYRPYVDLLETLDSEALVAIYLRYYPRLREAYADLGYRDDHLNDRVIAIIDHLLATPQPDGPIALVRPHVLYAYADPRLEALSAGQKFLLRMGPENAARVRGWLQRLRQRLSGGGPAAGQVP